FSACETCLPFPLARPSLPFRASVGAFASRAGMAARRATDSAPSVSRLDVTRHSTVPASHGSCASRTSHATESPRGAQIPLRRRLVGGPGNWQLVLGPIQELAKPQGRHLENCVLGSCEPEQH